LKGSFDVVVIGSGAAGTSAALALSERNLKVLVIEASETQARPNLSSRLPISWRRSPFLRPILSRLAGQSLQSFCYAWEQDPQGFVKDSGWPYSSEDFVWVRGARLGGRMSVEGHGRKFPRFDEIEFQQMSGSNAAWPLGLRDLSSHYDAVESLLGVATPVFLQREAVAEALWPGAPSQMLATGDFSPALTQLRAQPNVSFLSGTRVAHLIFDEAAGGALRALSCVTKSQGLTSFEIPATRVVLAASPFESSRILLASQFSERSPLLGRFIMDHVKSVIDFPVPDSLLRRGVERAQDFYVRHRGSRSGLEFGVQVYVGGDKRMRLSAFGPMQPRFENYLEIDEFSRDDWGIATLRVRCSHGEQDRALAEDQRDFLEKAAHSESCAVTLRPGLACHEAGGLRMGAETDNSVVNSDLQIWQNKEISVVDASVFPSVGSLNPTLTVMALARRAALGFTKTAAVP
jgi:choline dehydrogenase-like flavoprotein